MYIPECIDGCNAVKADDNRILIKFLSNWSNFINLFLYDNMNHALLTDLPKNKKNL